MTGIELEDYIVKREETITLPGKSILPFRLKDIDQDEMSFIIYELDDYPETQEEIKGLFHLEVKYRQILEEDGNN